MASDAGFNGHYTNYSLRWTIVTRLFEEGVDTAIIQKMIKLSRSSNILNIGHSESDNNCESSEIRMRHCDYETSLNPMRSDRDPVAINIHGGRCHFHM